METDAYSGKKCVFITKFTLKGFACNPPERVPGLYQEYSAVCVARTHEEARVEVRGHERGVERRAADVVEVSAGAPSVSRAPHTHVNPARLRDHVRRGCADVGAAQGSRGQRTHPWSCGQTRHPRRARRCAPPSSRSPRTRSPSVRRVLWAGSRAYAACVSAARRVRGTRTHEPTEPRAPAPPETETVLPCTR
jgi:hypothetical protein